MPISADTKIRRKTRKVFYGPPGDTHLYWNVKIKPATNKWSSTASWNTPLLALRAAP